MHELSETAPQHPKNATTNIIAPAIISTFEVIDNSLANSGILLNSSGIGLSKAPSNTIPKPKHCQ